MTRLLRIDASARSEDSVSRQIADYFAARFSVAPGNAIAIRDLVTAPIPHIANVTIKGYYTPPGQLSVQMKAATALSDLLIHELREADMLLISTPMYNFSIPSALKAWIDQIVRIGQTFSYDGKSFTGMLPGKRAVVVVAYGAGGYTNGGGFAVANFVEPYLRFLLNFLGIADVTFISVEQTTADDATLEANKRKAIADVDAWFAGPGYVRAG